MIMMRVLRSAFESYVSLPDIWGGPVSRFDIVYILPVSVPGVLIILKLSCWVVDVTRAQLIFALVQTPTSGSEMFWWWSD